MLLTSAQADTCLPFRRDTVSRVELGICSADQKKKKRKKRLRPAARAKCRSGVALSARCYWSKEPKPHSRCTNMCKTIASVKAPLAVTLRAGARALFPHLLPRAIGDELSPLPSLVTFQRAAGFWQAQAYRLKNSPAHADKANLYPTKSTGLEIGPGPKPLKI